MAVSAEITRIVADARTHLPGSVLSGIQAEFFAAAREFFDFTNMWTEEVDVPIVAGTRSYSIDPLAGGTIIRLMTLFNSEDENKAPVAPCSMAIPGVVVLGITPQTSATWVALVSKSCIDPATTEGYPDIPEWIVTKYWHSFFAGTLSKMFSQGGKPYSDNAKATFYKRVFMSQKSVARVEAVKANVYGQQNWRFPAFSQGSQRGV